MKKTLYPVSYSNDIALIISTGKAEKDRLETWWNSPGCFVRLQPGISIWSSFELFNYGDPSVYPDYYDHTYTEVSRYTKGSGIYRFMFESNHLIPGVEFISDLSYLPDLANQFYGFNGYESVFNKDWMDDESADYKSAMFYCSQRDQFRFRTDFLGNYREIT